MEAHSAPTLPHQNTTPLSFVVFERSTEAQLATESELLAGALVSNGRTEGVTNNIEIL